MLFVFAAVGLLQSIGIGFRKMLYLRINSYTMILHSLLLWIGLLFFQTPNHSEKEIIYTRRDGMALTMSVLTPDKPNGKAIVSLLSGGFYSDQPIMRLIATARCRLLMPAIRCS